MKNTEKRMRLIFIRHGMNDAADLATGQHNSPITYLNEEGKEGVKNSAIAIKKVIGEIDPERLYLYTPTLVRTMQTSDIVSQIVGVPDYHCYADDLITGRDYGEITRISLEQDIPEKEIKKPKFILSHGKLAMDYIRAMRGKKNASYIEPKNEFVERIDLFMDKLFLRHDIDDVIIISANSDMWKHLIKSAYYDSPLVSFSTKDSLAPAGFAVIDIDSEKLDEYRTNAMTVVDGLNYIEADDNEEPIK